MAIKIQQTNKYIPRPKFMIYGDPGDGKTSLCSTVKTEGEKDILYAFTEGGVQTIAHLDLPYVDIRRPSDYTEFYEMLKNGKKEPGQLGIWVGNQFFRGIIIDLFGHLVQMNLIDLVRDAKSKNADRDIDDPSEYEYKKINFRMIRQINELSALPLKYMGFTAYVERRVEQKTGVLLESKPAFVGSKIWQSAAGAMDYVFRISPPLNVKDAAKYRTLRTQPAQNIYAKARVPGVPPVHPVVLDQDSDAGGPGKTAHITVMRKPHDALVSMAHGSRDEPFGIIKTRMRMAAEQLDKSLYGQAGRQFAVHMATHAIGKHQQQRVVAICVSDSILVEFAIADMAGLVYREVHERENGLTG